MGRKIAVFAARQLIRIDIGAACTVHILLHVSGLHEKPPGPVLDKVASLDKEREDLHEEK